MAYSQDAVRLLEAQFLKARDEPCPQAGGWSEEVRIDDRRSCRVGGQPLVIELVDVPHTQTRCEAGSECTVSFKRCQEVFNASMKFVKVLVAAGLDRDACGGE